MIHAYVTIAKVSLGAACASLSCRSRTGGSYAVQACSSCTWVLRMRVLSCSVFLISVDDAATGAVRAQLERDFVAEHNLDVVDTHPPGQVRENDATVVKLYPECRVGERFDDRPVHLYLRRLVQRK